jgi:quercetin dioxygenase-like cupin family protein
MEQTRLAETILEAKDVPKVEMFPGFWRQTLVNSDSLMLCLLTWAAGATLPEHSHPHEQAGFVISGAVQSDNRRADVCHRGRLLVLRREQSPTFRSCAR